MSIIQFFDVTKMYKLDEKRDKYALDNINLCFGNGLTCILGKSGSGKSTLLNMIGLLDYPSKGKIVIDGCDLSRLTNKKKDKYRSTKCGFIFQHYHLLEKHSALFNAVLPSLILGSNFKESVNKAKAIFAKINFKKELLDSRVCNLSGGEKQRVAIVRALMNNPDILLADEPTGALDKENSKEIMHILKEISKEKTVLIVTHNSELAEEYSDRIITINDGKITNDLNKKLIKDKPITKSIKKKALNDAWSDHIIINNIWRRLLRNSISCASLIISIVATILIVGFSIGSQESIEKEKYKKFDIGVGTISKESTHKANGSSLSLIKTSRPSIDELQTIKSNNPSFVFTHNYDYLLSGYELSIGENKLDEAILSPIYSFQEPFVDKNLIIDGVLPKNNLNECIVNKAFKINLGKNNNLSIVGQIIHLKISNHIDYFTGEAIKPYISDYFDLEKDIIIKGVVDEINFLSVPKIYFSYESLEEYVENTCLNNLSTYRNTDVSWRQRVVDASDTEQLSSYSYYCFLKDVKSYRQLNEFVKYNDIVYTNNNLIVGETLQDLIEVSCTGMEIFMIIAIVGCILILGMISFSNYSEDRKSSAVLRCLGATENMVEDLYISENLTLGMLSSIVAIIISYFLQRPINWILKLFLNLENLISIPIESFLNIKLLFPLIIVGSTILISIISTVLPIRFSKKISLKEELADE